VVVCCIYEKEESVAQLRTLVMGRMAQLCMCQERMENSEIGMAERSRTGWELRCVWCGGFYTVVGREVEQVADKYVDKDVEVIGVKVFLRSSCGEH